MSPLDSDVRTDVGHRVAVVGAGPSGCYAAMALRKLSTMAEIVVFDSRPLPFGLVRNGIAPDHQGMKAVARQFERLFAAPEVQFVGNVAIGRDLPVEALRAFDGIVFATGLERDASLSVPTDSRARVFGAGSLIRQLNGDPDVSREHAPD